MTVELLQVLSLVAYIAAGVLVLVSVAEFFLLDVPKLYGDISGRTARKAIENIRMQNESSGNKAYKPSAVNAARGKLTDRITQSGRLERQTDGLPVSVGTEKFDTAVLQPQNNETTLLTADLPPANETTLLTGEASDTNETTLLTAQSPAAPQETVVTEVEISFADSQEIIE